MNILEYESKQILQQFNIPVPTGTVVSSDSVILKKIPTILKSQVHTGGRGKAGGIRIVKTVDEATRTMHELFNLPIKGEIPEVLLAEELLDIAQEYYLSLVINRSEASIELIAHRDGGIDIESQDQSSFFRRLISKHTSEGVGDALADYLDLPQHAFTLQDIVDSLLACFVTEDVTLLEINPLILTTQGDLVAGDCKMTLDDDALYRHPNRTFTETPKNTNFVTLDKDGTVATIANGAGLAMATVDAVKEAHLIPANFLDIGGTATVESILSSFRQIVDFPHISAIVINIFGGIVRCDEVAKAVIEARQQVEHLPALYIRLTGTNSDIAETLLREDGLTLYPTLADCLRGISRA